MDAAEEWRYLRRMSCFLLATALVVYLFFSIYSAVIVPICLGFFLTYILMPLVERLEKVRMSRLAVASTAMVVALLLFVLIFTRLIPLLYSELTELVVLFPAAYRTLMERWVPWIREFVIEAGLVDGPGFDEWMAMSGVPGRLTSQIESAVTTIMHSAPHLISVAISFILTPIITFFTLLHYEKILKLFRRIVPVDLKPGVSRMLGVCHRTLQDVIRSHITIASILAAMYVCSFSIIGLGSSVAIGLVAGACRVVPYLDIVVGGFLCLLVILSDFQSWWQIFEVAVVILAIQTFDGVFITPRVVGGRFGVHPLVVVVSVLALSAALGFWGVLLAIPFVTLINALVKELWPIYKNSHLYRQGLYAEKERS